MSGNLLWKQKLEFPYNQEIFEQAVEQAIKPPGGLPAINYITEFNIIEGEAYFLSYIRSKDDNQLLIKLSEEGVISVICTLPSNIGYVSNFDISVDQNMLYLASSDDGIAYRVESPF